MRALLLVAVAKDLLMKSLQMPSLLSECGIVTPKDDIENAGKVFAFGHA